VFDNIGVQSDPDAARRSAASLLLTTALLAAGSATLMALSAYTATQVVQSELAAQFVELIEAVEEPVVLPPPPPPAAADAPTEEESESDEPSEVQELQDAVADEIKSDAKPAGAVGGVVGGVPGGVVGAAVPAPATPPIKAFHPSELEIKKRVAPEYPAEALAAHLGEQKCIIRVVIDEEGVPKSVSVASCPKEFHASAKDSISRWRWYPAKEGGRAIQAQTSISVVYKPQGS
jgi:periplasmic protein TonB